MDTLKFEQDVGLQTEIEPSQDLSTQTDQCAWILLWLQETSEQLRAIEIELIKDTNELLSHLEALHTTNLELVSNQQMYTQDHFHARLQFLEKDLSMKQQQLLSHGLWEKLIKEVIEKDDKEKIRLLLEIIPKGAPFSKRLKEALNSRSMSFSFEEVITLIAGSLNAISYQFLHNLCTRAAQVLFLHCYFPLF